jgi:hypothetical protein
MSEAYTWVNPLDFAATGGYLSASPLQSAKGGAESGWVGAHCVSTSTTLTSSTTLSNL